MATATMRAMATVARVMATATKRGKAARGMEKTTKTAMATAVRVIVMGTKKGKRRRQEE